ncbi:MAG: DUF433 domain-containing protein [Phycisphaeraceae bacterium]
MLKVVYPHIEVPENGPAAIAGTRIKVVEIALDHLTHHWDAEEIQRQHPHLKLGQIHSALAYYFDHQDQLDRQIEDRLRQEEAILSTHSDATLRTKLQRVRRA